VFIKKSAMASDNTNKIRLSELPVGHKAIIREFEQSSTTALDREDIHLKLMEMGCVPGETVTIVKIAPLGDPISIAVAGYNLSLRRSEAHFIWVEEVMEKIRVSY
jgi:ferrous iron transport protein A